jgi:hypothetical protein
VTIEVRSSGLHEPVVEEVELQERGSDLWPAEATTCDAPGDVSDIERGGIWDIGGDRGRVGPSTSPEVENLHRGSPDWARTYLASPTHLLASRPGRPGLSVP